MTTEILNSLPVRDSRVAWTVDDGTNPESIRRYALFAQETGTRLTIFPNGSYPGWTTHADLWREVVQSGQVQVGNHTWSHTELTSLDDDEIVAELERNEAFVQALWGVTTKPYLRPPNGPRDERTDAAAARAGWTKQAMWSALLVEGPTKTADDLIASAQTAFEPGSIVIGHANYEAMQEALGQVLESFTSRGLRSVTLRDVFGE